MAHIAIVGSGISGMAAAYLLKSHGHHITLYEQAARVGGHTRTMHIDYHGHPIAVDTGFIVYNHANYPHLSAMFRYLQVPTQPSNMSFAISLNWGAMEWGARSLNAVFGQRRNLIRPDFYRLIRQVYRFNTHAFALSEQHPEWSLAQLVQHLGLSQSFCNLYLLPMGGAIWSCPPKQMLAFPARTFVQFFKNHGLLGFSGQHQWYTVTGGAQRYIEKLTASYHTDIRLNTGVRTVYRDSTGVNVVDSSGTDTRYDQIVFACHADQTLRMLQDASTQEREILGCFHYQRNVAYLHRDPSQMPKRKRCWASWVYCANGSIGEEPQIAVTYWMNLLQSIDARYPLFVTLNPATPIAEACIFDRHEFEHPIFTQDAIRAQALLPSIQGQQRSWFCGAYTRYGFHEDGLLSAVNVAQALGASVPWL